MSDPKPMTINNLPDQTQQYITDLMDHVNFRDVLLYICNSCETYAQLSPEHSDIWTFRAKILGSLAGHELAMIEFMQKQKG